MRDIGQALVDFPRFLWWSVAGLVVALLTDYETLVTTVAVILLSFVISPFVAIAGGLLFLVVARLVSKLTGQLNFIGIVLRDNAGVFRDIWQDQIQIREARRNGEL